MPVTVQLNLRLPPNPVTTVGLNATSPAISSDIVFPQHDTSNVADTKVFSIEELVTVTGVASQLDLAESTTGALIQQDLLQYFTNGFAVAASILDNIQTPMNLDVGTPPLSLNPFRVTTPLNLVEVIQQAYFSSQFPLSQYLVIAPRALEEEVTLVVDDSTPITVTGGLNLVDLLGPQILNEVPASGSTYNNKATTIGFDLRDTGGSIIVASATRIFVNSTMVVDASVPLVTSGFGSTQFVQISPSFYQFLFTPSVPFALGSTVVVSGTARDSISPVPNINNFNYSFRVWAEDNLGATISGSPDSIPPYLINVSPAASTVDIPVDTTIQLTIIDDHTGLNTNSVNIALDSTILVLNGNLIPNLDYSVVTASVSGGKGRQYLITPTSDLAFGTTYTISGSASDLYQVPNSFNFIYQFQTQTNNHLVASGLRMLTVSGYDEFEIYESLPTQALNTFRVDYFNGLGLTIDTANSYVSNKGVTVPATFTSITGSPSHYEVQFQLAPDYFSDSDLKFHVQQLETVSGNIVYRDFYANLLWGYEVIYDPDKLPRESKITSIVQVSDFATYPTLSTNIIEFKTEPPERSLLLAEITGTPLIKEDLFTTVSSVNPYFEYGKTMSMKLEAADFAGNKLVYSWSFVIESKP